MYRAQPYIQLEEVVKNFANQSINRGDDGEKPEAALGRSLCR